MSMFRTFRGYILGWRKNMGKWAGCTPWGLKGMWSSSWSLEASPSSSQQLCCKEMALDNLQFDLENNMWKRLFTIHISQGLLWSIMVNLHGSFSWFLCVNLLVFDVSTALFRHVSSPGNWRPIPHFIPQTSPGPAVLPQPHHRSIVCCACMPWSRLVQVLGRIG